MQHIEEQGYRFLDEYEPVEVDFDLQGFKQELELIVNKYMQVKVNKGEKRLEAAGMRDINESPIRTEQEEMFERE